MRNPKVYDKAQWHYESEENYPPDLPDHQAYVHTGMYLAWLLERGLTNDHFLSSFSREISSLRERTITGAELFESVGGVFADDMLTAEGNAFTQSYFDFQAGAYLSEYDEILGDDLPTLYHVQDTWENYDKIKPLLNRRYEEWRSKQMN